MTWVLAVVAILLVFVALWQWGRRPAVHKVAVADLRKYLQVLLRRGYPGGFMIIRERDKKNGQKRFIQFSKYVASPGRIGIELAFPLSGWSQEYYEQLKELLGVRGITYRVERTGRSDTREFLNVDFARDLDQAESIAQSALHDVFGLAGDSVVDVHYENVSPHDELIDGKGGTTART